LAVVGIDPSSAYISFARHKVTDKRATFAVGSAESLEYPDGTFEAVVSGLVLNFVPHADRAVVEMRRVTVPDGIVAAYVWDYAGKMELMRYFWDAAVSLDQTVLRLDEGRRFPLCQPQPLQQLFESASLRRVEVRAIDVATVFRDFDDYWNPFLGGQAPAPSYAMSLTQPQRDELRDRLRATLPVQEDGTIRLIARAWAVRGVK
jgi:SAM-dependent methyltransferase